MSPSSQSSYLLFKQSEKEYLAFLNKHLHMLISYMQIMKPYASLSSVQKNAEQQLVISLNLIEKLMMHLYLRKIWLENDREADLVTQMDGEISEMWDLLSDLTSYVKGHNFVSNPYREQCLVILQQLSRYLPKRSVSMLRKDPPPEKPWRPHH